MSIKRLEEKDVDQVAEMIHYWHGESAEVEAVKSMLEDVLKLPDRHFVFVAVEEERVVAFAHWVLFRNVSFGTLCGELEGIYVYPNYRQKGIGKALMQAGMDATLKAGAIEYIVVDVVLSNLPALILYQNMGFNKVTLVLGKHKWAIKRPDGDITP